jgi:ribosomal protein S18 acetylase RimI-like enzyme
MRVQEAGEDATAALANCLALSYRDNPLLLWMYGDEINDELLCGLFTGLVGGALSQGSVYKTEGITGAAIWNRTPHREQPVPSQTAVTLQALTTDQRRSAALGVLGSHRPTQAHLYLAAVGVLPSERRQGLASALVGPLLRLSEEARVDAYLENSDPNNTSFYEGLGFVETATLPMPQGCPPVVAMVRIVPSQPGK